MKFYYSLEGRSAGPLTEDQFKALVQEGTITSDTLVWKEGMADWKAFREAEMELGLSKKPSKDEPSFEFDTSNLEMALAKAAAAAKSENEKPAPLKSAVSEGVVEKAPLEAPKMVPAPPQGPRQKCLECGKDFPEDEMAPYEESWVCADCQPAFFKKLKEEVLADSPWVPAGVGPRAGAKSLDLCLLGILVVTVQIPLLGSLLGGIILPANLIGAMILSLAYFFFFTRRWGATPGKRILGLKIVNPDGNPISSEKALRRSIAEILGFATLGMGYLLALGDSEKRSLMDRLAGTRVVAKSVE